jgi:hypothetical protein
VLSRAGLGDDPPLPDVASEQHLADAVVDLVRAGVVQVLALQPDLRAARVLGEALGEVERRRAADVVGEQVQQLTLKRRRGHDRPVGALKLEQAGHERLGHVTPTEGSEMSARVREDQGWLLAGRP